MKILTNLNVRAGYRGEYIQSYWERATLISIVIVNLHHHQQRGSSPFFYILGNTRCHCFTLDPLVQKNMRTFSHLAYYSNSFFSSLKFNFKTSQRKDIKIFPKETDLTYLILKAKIDKCLIEYSPLIKIRLSH